jgi:hypothetical protein
MNECQRHQNYAGQYQVFCVACSSAIETYYLRAPQQEFKTRSKTTTPIRSASSRSNIGYLLRNNFLSKMSICLLQKIIIPSETIPLNDVYAST